MFKFEKIKSIEIKEDKLKQSISKKIGKKDVYRLADVLRVLEKINVDYAIGSNGILMISEEYLSLTYKDLDIEWNLTKNDISLQSKQTIDFLANLICKQK